MDFGTVIWVIIIGGMLYLMMKGGGCCGGHSKKEGHGHDAGSKSGESGAGTDHEHKKSCH